MSAVYAKCHSAARGQFVAGVKRSIHLPTPSLAEREPVWKVASIHRSWFFLGEFFFFYSLWSRNPLLWAGEVAQPLQGLAAKLDDPSSVPRSLMVEGEN